MVEEVNTRLVTREEARNWMECDHCGLRVPAKPWPRDWTGCGISRRRVLRDAKQASTPAYWCPEHQDQISDTPNLKERDLRAIRDRLVAEESVGASAATPVESELKPEMEPEPEQPTIRWSARREGLVPMPTKEWEKRK